MRKFKLEREVTETVGNEKRSKLRPQKEKTMPKNTNRTILRSKARSKSTARKPLRDVSNVVTLSSKSTATEVSRVCKEEDKGGRKIDGNGALDRLLLIHSDLSSLIHQIDELVVQALSLTSRKATEEVESFANFLSEMHSSFKPWIPRFLKALFDIPSKPENQLEQSVEDSEIASTNKTMNHVQSPEQTTMDSLVSPSPLVSWRADCNVERGRQLFLLTPLPRPKELSLGYIEKSASMFGNITSRKTIQPPTNFDVAGEEKHNLLEEVKPTPCKISATPSKISYCNLETVRVSPEKFSRTDSSMLVMTPCLKISPPKSCVLLEPISEFTHKGGHALYKSVPFPAGVGISKGSEDSESSNSQVSQYTSLTYPDFLGIKLGENYINRKKVEEEDESPNWLTSPPKTCILMEPDDKMLRSLSLDERFPEVASIVHKDKTLLSGKENNIKGNNFTKVACKTVVDCTPMLKEPESTIQRGKHPGENTLKKELWTKFEAASTDGFHFSVPFLPKATQKGFLDRLDEVS